MNERIFVTAYNRTHFLNIALDVCTDVLNLIQCCQVFRKHISNTSSCRFELIFIFKYVGKTNL